MPQARACLNNGRNNARVCGVPLNNWFGPFRQLLFSPTVNRRFNVSQRCQQPSPNSARSPASIVLLVAAVGCLAITPIESDELWWQLSRGRAVIDGAVAPCQELLTADVAREADWLGGVPFYLVHSIADVSGLMALKLAVVSGFAWLLWSRANALPHVAALTLTFAGLLAIAGAGEPAPLMFDTLALLLVDRLARRWLVKPSWINALGVVGLFLVWSNLARLPALGLASLAIVLLCRDRSADRQPTNWQSWRLVGVAAIASCVTPRGWWTLWDSLRLLMPWIAAPFVVVQQYSAWQPLAWTQWGLPEFAFGILTVAGVIGLINRVVRNQSSGRPGLLFLLGQFIAWTSNANLTLGAVLTTLALIDAWPTRSSDVAASFRNQPLLWCRALRPILFVTASLILICRASGWLPNCPNRLGWGLVPHLDPAPLQQALQQTQLRGTVHCVGIRAAGMLSWLRPNGLTAFDIPQRALLGRRLPVEAALNRDLLHGREFSYRRADLSDGGWWIPLQKRGTALLLVDDGYAGIIRQLCQDAESIWRPFSLQSSVVPFGKAGDPGCSHQIIETLRFERYLTWAAPAAKPISNSGSDTHWDLWGTTTKTPDPSASVRQARLLNAMQLHIPAIRLLAPVLNQTNSHSVRSAFAAGQLALAYSERLEVGQPSHFRSLAFRSTADMSLQCKVAYATLPAEAELRKRNPELFNDNTRYVNGKPPAVDASQLPAEPTGDPAATAELLYARGWWLIESGQLTMALAVFENMLSTYPDHHLSRLVRRNVQDAREFQ